MKGRLNVMPKTGRTHDERLCDGPGWDVKVNLISKETTDFSCKNGKLNLKLENSHVCHAVQSLISASYQIFIWILDSHSHIEVTSFELYYSFSSLFGCCKQLVLFLRHKNIYFFPAAAKYNKF